jgi:predicted GNAT family N-acyltransferase
MTKITVEPASWRAHEAELVAIRRRVFIEEQSVPEALEWDGEDAAAWHWLARSGDLREAIGTVRLLPGGRVTRMAVLAPWRGRGAGAALLQAVIDHARELDLRELHLHAQTHALRFYQRFGFQAHGPEFRDAGIPHRSMTLQLRSERLLGEDAGRIAVRDLPATLLDLASQCRRQLRLLCECLDPDLFDNPAFADALSQLARGHRHNDVRLLLVDTRPLVERGHRLLALQRRLPSSIHIRRVGQTAEPLHHAWLIADGRGVLCYDQREPASAWADYNNAPLAEDYRSRFDELWNRADVAPELRLLSL